MLKKLLLVVFAALVICSHSILLTHGADDEFAEFDDFVPPSETKTTTTTNQQQNQDSSQPARESPSPAAAAAGGGADQVSLDEAEIRIEHIESKESDKHRTTGRSDEESREDVDDKHTTQKKPDLRLVNAPLPKLYTWESYYIEIAFLLATFLYTVNFFVGSNTNHKFAQVWYEQSRELLKHQFTLVGGAPQLNDGAQKRDDDDSSSSSSTAKKQRGLIKSTESIYTLWNSGRVGMDGLLIEINLLKRQDLFSMALNLLKPTKDCLIMRFLLNQEGYDNFVFCLAYKTFAPKLARDLVDINTFCPKRKPLSQYGADSELLFVMSELSDVASFILDQRTLSFLKKNERSIQFIHITDQYSTIRSDEVLPAQKLANPKRMATFSFSFPRNSTDCAEYLLFALSLLDRLRRFKLARDSKQKSEKNRQKITDILQKTAFSQRQEAAANKKEELRRLEKERIYNEDDPEKQRRWERKEAKRELKKNKMRVKQLKVKSM